MEMQEFYSFLVNAFLFFLAYKVGQLSVWFKIGQQNRNDIQTKLEAVRQTSLRPVITVEEINGVYYAYDGNDFLAQGKNPDELGKLIANRFPEKYHLAKVEIKG